MLPNVEYIKTLVNGLKEFINTKIKSVRKDMDELPRVQFNPQSLTDKQKAQARENIGAQEYICGEDVVETSAGYGYGGFISSAGYGPNTIYKARIGRTYFESIQCNNPRNTHPEYTLGEHTITLNFNAKTMDVSPNDISSSEIEFFKQETQVTEIPEKYIPKEVILVKFYKEASYGNTICEKTYAELKTLLQNSGHEVILYSGAEHYYLESAQTSGDPAGIRFVCPNGRAVTIGSDDNNTWDLGYFATESYVDSVALPAVTTSDNGKILKVVDGAWAVVDA